ncbi:MAG: hypothetical protein AABN34_14740 [Acidobacteriota bacterium]
MSLHFPPQPSHTRDIKHLLQVLASVVSPRGAVYLSAPITSGKRFVRHSEGNSVDLNRDELVRHVITPNLAHAASIVERLRREGIGPLIDPTAVDDFADWTQDDYRHLWGSVIERYAHTVVFVDDWHHSNGCAYEFLVAQRCGLTTRNERDSIISLQDGIELVQSAIEESKAMGTRTTFLEHVLDALCEVQSSDRQVVLSSS